MNSSAIIIIQFIILAFGYGFLGAILYYDYLAPPDRISNLLRQYPGELTMVVTLIATVLSVANAILFSMSIREVLRHRMSRPIPLIQLSASVALAKGSVILRPEYLRLTILTLFVYGVQRLLTAGLLIKWVTQVRDDAFEVLDIGGMLSGVAAAGHTYGLPGTFNFNGARYNISTQGIVPTIEDYSGDATSGTRLGFSGGNVTVNTQTIPDRHTSISVPQGFSRNYSMSQQGLTADVSCRAIDLSQYVWETNNSIVIYANSAASNTSITGLRLWNITTDCGTNTLTTQEYVTMVDASGNASLSGSGFLPSIVCPGLSLNLNQTYTSFTILSQGFYKYSFLNATVCDVVPFLTTVHTKYSNDLISSYPTSNTPFQSDNAILLSFIAGVARFQAINSQGLLSSSIGDTLYSIYSSTSNTTIDDNLGNQTQVYQELFLRSGFMVVGSFPNNTIPNNVSSPVNGTMYISTIGWTKRSPTYLLAVLPITIITILILACTVYSLVQLWKERDTNRYRTTFDVSNTLHLIMATAAGDLALKNFDDKGIVDNEGVRVRLEEPKDDNGVVKKLIQVGLGQKSMEAGSPV
ncbi:hypothetical protein DFH29DRAFT_1072661 [Suillus ampliporus]|nr:hypothetical protein DFH29DRAFT_1072661 [Suillus ampliporus]